MPFNAFLQLALTGETTATGAAEVVAAFRTCYLVATGFVLLGALTSLVRGRHAVPSTAVAATAERAGALEANAPPASPVS